MMKMKILSTADKRREKERGGRMRFVGLVFLKSEGLVCVVNSKGGGESRGMRGGGRGREWMRFGWR